MTISIKTNLKPQRLKKLTEQRGGLDNICYVSKSFIQTVVTVVILYILSLICKYVFPKIYQLRKVHSGFFFILRTGKIYMNLLQHYFLENLRKNSNRGVGGDKNLDVHSLFQGGRGYFKLDGCRQRGWGSQKI